MSPKKPSVPVDARTYLAMQDYAELYQLSLSDLVARMWQLWYDVDRARNTGVFPSPPTLQERMDEPLDTFLAEMQQEANTSRLVTRSLARDWLNSLDDEIRL